MRLGEIPKAIGLLAGLSGCATTFKAPTPQEQIAGVVQKVRDQCKDPSAYAIVASCTGPMNWAPFKVVIMDDVVGGKIGGGTSSIENDLNALREKYQKACEDGGGTLILRTAVNCSAKESK